MAGRIPAGGLTVDDLAQFPDDSRLRELVDGQLVEWDAPTWFHGYFLNALAHLLTTFVQQRRLGVVVSGDPLVRVQAGERDARGPDVAFYARGRIPRDRSAAATEVAPDFVIEVLSPSDRAGEVERKVEDWLRAGVRLLWYVNPESGLTTVYQGKEVRRVVADQDLNGAEVLPGFRLRIQDVLDELAAPLEPDR